MRAMVLERLHHPLKLESRDIPKPNEHQLLIRVKACGICRTDLHVVDGELPHPKLPIVPGHQIVGVVEESGREVRHFKKGQRVGVPWLGGSCGICKFCRSGRENLCDQAQFTGYQLDGGFAEYCIADARFCFPIPDAYPNEQAAPLFVLALLAIGLS
ncbi:alcohol dehydrogenase [Legionella jordanis]|uniref:Alcohol dehydrogenase n=1 Tax=Legionella jordanis TaxID=456 RepID=A0A0W0V7N2_9GAMM|nr:alcohol dehydrogenase [Legionella jordanis]VEH12424.1 alcohol dehydrogenase [Legionella jordanis]